MVCGSLQAIGIPHEQIIPLLDSMSFGPYRAPSQRGWTIRDRYWTDLVSVFPLAERPAAPLQNDAVALLEARDRLVSAKDICLWMGPSLDEVLSLVVVFDVLGELRINLDKVSRVYVAVDPASGKRIPSLRRLSANGFRQALDSGEKFSDLEIRTIHEISTAFASSDPADLDNLCSRGSEKTRDWVQSACLLRRRYPLEAHGLPIHLLRMLQLIENGSTTVSDVLAKYLLAFSVEFDCPGDIALEAQLLRLTGQIAGVALVDVQRPYSARSIVRLTDVGCAVLRGEMNNIDINGVDDWVGGVHLDSRNGHVWVFSEASGRIARMKK